MSDIVFDFSEDNVEDVINAKDEALTRAMEAIGIQAEGHTKTYCPVDTGRLRGSISHQSGSGFDRSVYIGTNVEYAPYMEFGTSKGHKAHHYLQRGIENHLDEYKNILHKFLKSGS